MRLRRSGLFGLVLLICMAVAAPSAAAGLEVKPIHTPPPRPSQSDPRVAELEAEGYGLSDILTALDFEWKSGVAPQVWLEKHSETGQWLDVAAHAAEIGAPLQNPWRSSEAAAVDERTRNRYQDQGYSILEVFEAAGLARDFGITMEEAFTLFHERGGMRAAERHLTELAEGIIRVVPTDSCTLVAWVGENGESLKNHPEFGISRDEFCWWTAKGYTLGDILNAASAAMSLQATIEELLILRAQGLEWSLIYAMIPVTESHLTAQTGLVVEQIREWVKRGFTHADIKEAAYWAVQRYQSVEEVLQEFDEKGRDWKEYGINNPTPANIALTLGWPLEKVVALVKKGAKPLWILQADHTARTTGLNFDAVLESKIKNNGRRATTGETTKKETSAKEDPDSYEELRKLLRMPAATQVTFSTDEFNTLRGLGFDDEEMAKIGLIAKAVKRPAMEVAIKKRSGIGWRDLINQLKKK